LYHKLLDTFRARTISHADLKDLVFGQQHYGTQRFFVARHGQCHTVTLEQFPHCEFLERWQETPFEAHSYRQYLDAEWGYKCAEENTEANQRENIQRFIDLYRSVAERAREKGPRRAFLKPIIVTERLDGRKVIIHGNHRAAVALKLGLDMPACYYSRRRFLAKTAVKMVPKERYGDYKGQMPQQSLFVDGREVVRGRHRGMKDRFRYVTPTDLRGSSVLELGCSIGSHCFLAAQGGATSVVGVDCRPERVSIAIRLNAFFAAPCYFEAQDVCGTLTHIQPVDTVLCFTLLDDVPDQKALARTIVANTKKVLYIEGVQERVEAYDFLLNKEYFRMIDRVGCVVDQPGRGSRRYLYRCEVHRD
jgi:hypothetical protein